MPGSCNNGRGEQSSWQQLSVKTCLFFKALFGLAMKPVEMMIKATKTQCSKLSYVAKQL